MCVCVCVFVCVCVNPLELNVIGAGLKLNRTDVLAEVLHTENVFITADVV